MKILILKFWSNFEPFFRQSTLKPEIIFKKFNFSICIQNIPLTYFSIIEVGRGGGRNSVVLRGLNCAGLYFGCVVTWMCLSIKNDYVLCFNTKLTIIFNGQKSSIIDIFPFFSFLGNVSITECPKKLFFQFLYHTNYIKIGKISWTYKRSTLNRFSISIYRVSELQPDPQPCATFFVQVFRNLF